MCMNVLGQQLNKGHSSHFPNLDFMLTKQPSDYNLAYSNLSSDRESIEQWT